MPPRKKAKAADETTPADVAEALKPVEMTSAELRHALEGKGIKAKAATARPALVKMLQEALEAGLGASAAPVDISTREKSLVLAHRETFYDLFIGPGRAWGFAPDFSDVRIPGTGFFAEAAKPAKFTGRGRRLPPSHLWKSCAARQNGALAAAARGHESATDVPGRSEHRDLHDRSATVATARRSSLRRPTRQTAR